MGRVLGRFAGRYLTYGGVEHAIIVGASRSGKGAGHVVPTLISWPHSAFVYDRKGELWHITADHRKSFSHVFYFAADRSQYGALEPAVRGPQRRHGDRRHPECRRHPRRSLGAQSGRSELLGPERHGLLHGRHPARALQRARRGQEPRPGPPAFDQHRAHASRDDAHPAPSQAGPSRPGRSGSRRPMASRSPRSIPKSS